MEHMRRPNQKETIQEKNALSGGLIGAVLYNFNYNICITNIFLVTHG